MYHFQEGKRLWRPCRLLLDCNSTRPSGVRLSVRDNSEHCENDERYAMVTPGYTGDQSSIPYDHPFPQFPKLRLHNPIQNLHRKLQPNGARYNGGLYWQPMGTYHRHTQQYHCLSLTGTTSPQKGQLKINSKLLQNCNRYLMALYTRHVGTHWHHQRPPP